MSVQGCCETCFGDEGLSNQVFPRLAGDTGDCSFCGSTNVKVVEPSLLEEHFDNLLGIYEAHDSGEALVDILGRDWGLFSSGGLSKEKKVALLAAVTGDSDLALKKHAASESFQSAELGNWQKLRTEIMHNNRWFLENEVNLEDLFVLLGNLSRKLPASTWYRARISHNGQTLSGDEMGAPPQGLATNGRANPAGIPYLYVASDKNTAVAEIRPHTGEKVTVAQIQLPELGVVDLVNARKRASPFMYEEPSEVGKLRANLPLLEHLADELTRAVRPSETAINYIPSQYLCEFIRSRGFEGVVYKSSVGIGKNLVRFDVEIDPIKQVELLEVTKVLVELDS